MFKNVVSLQNKQLPMHSQMWQRQWNGSHQPEGGGRVGAVQKLFAQLPAAWVFPHWCSSTKSLTSWETFLCYLSSLPVPVCFPFSRISKFVKEKEQSSLLITLLLPFLCRGGVAQVWIHSSDLFLKWQFIRFVCEK